MGKSPKADTILKEARTAIDQGHANQAELRQTVSLLEGYQYRFPSDIRFPLYLAEAYYRLADPSADVSREFPIYEKVEFYAQKVLAMDPNRAEGHYWHGLYLLKKAQKTGGIRAFFIVRRGIAELQRVRQDLPTYDHAGASRVLGLLYYLAPGWTPFGNLNKSVSMGEEATRLAPDYMLNRLYLADAYKKRGDKADAIREYQVILSASDKMPEPEAQDFSDHARTMLQALDNQG